MNNLNNHIGTGFLLTFICIFNAACSELKQPKIESKLTVHHTKIDNKVIEIKVSLIGKFYNSNYIALENIEDIEMFSTSLENTLSTLKSIKEEMVITEQTKADSSFN